MKRCFTLWRFLIITVCVILLSGCKSLKQTVEVPVYVHDTAYLAKEVHDSTYIDRWHTIEVKGDTVFVTNEQIIVKLRTITDTAYKYVEKPVTVTVEQIKEVEKPLTWWQKGLMWCGALGILTALAAVVVRLRRSIIPR